MTPWRLKNLMSTIAVIRDLPRRNPHGHDRTSGRPVLDLVADGLRGGFLLFTVLFRLTVPWKGIKRSRPVQEDIL